jgi:guanylate kinase
MISMSGTLFVISAPSGGGKSTIAAAIREHVASMGYSISHTTRRPRSGERDGVDYHFVDQTTFSKMIDDGAFLEWARVYDALYGTSLSEIRNLMSTGRDILMDVDTQGGRNIKARFPESVLIFLVPPSLDVLEQRLEKRGTDNEQVIHTRMEQAMDDIRNCAWYDYIVVNDKLAAAIQETQSIILSERCLTERQLPKVKKMFDF